MGLYSFCNGDPVNNFDPDGRFGKGVQAGENGSITVSDPTSPAFYAGSLLGGTLSGAGSGIKNGAGGETSIFTLGHVQGAFGSDPTSSEYAMGQAGAIYAAVPAAAAATIATGGAALEAAPALFEVAGVAGTITESGAFVSSVPAGGTGIANLASIAARQQAALLLAPGGITAATYTIANSKNAVNWTQGVLSVAGFSTGNPPSPTTPWQSSVGGLIYKTIINPK